MALVTRASLGAEFFDITSSMLLKQPEPQFLYALLWKMSVSAELSKASGISFRGNVGNSGVAYDTAKSQRALFEDPIYSAAIKVVPELGNGVGHTVRMNRPVFANTTYTEVSREVPMGLAISTTPINIASEQVSVTLKRYSGPYDQANSRVAPYGVDRFDATRSVHAIASIVGEQLQRDFDKTIESFIGNSLSLASTVVRPNDYAADTAFGNLGGDGPMSYKLINRTERLMDDANLPTFGDGFRAMVVPPIALEQLKDDPQFARYAEFNPPNNPLLAAQYYKSVGRMHLFKSTSLPTTTNGSTGTVYISHAFAPGVIGSAVGEMPHAATSTADNYGEWALVIWLMYGAFQNLDSRFCVVVKTN